MTTDTQQTDNNQKHDVVMSAHLLQAYEAPTVECRSLRLVTLGGSIGDGDSGDPNNQAIPGMGGSGGQLNPQPGNPDS